MTTGLGHELKFAKVDCASSGANTVVAAVAGKRHKVLSYVIVASGAVTAEWRQGTTPVTGAMSLAANGGVAASGDPNLPLFETAANALIGLQLGGAVQVSGHITYITEADAV